MKTPALRLLATAALGTALLAAGCTETMNLGSAQQPRGDHLVYCTADSPFAGAKPADLTAIAEAMRTELTGALEKAGYTVATAPGPDILLLRLALTDVYLQPKPRGVLEYTPIGFVVGTGISAQQADRSTLGSTG